MRWKLEISKKKKKEKINLIVIHWVAAAVMRKQQVLKSKSRHLIVFLNKNNKRSHNHYRAKNGINHKNNKTSLLSMMCSR